MTHKCELNFLSRSDGSALYSIGNTVALASVYGPGDTKKSNRLYNKAHLEVCYSPSTGQSMVAERALEAIITRTIEQIVLVHLHPRTGINITIQEMQSDGLALSASINAACMALMDGGIHMNNTFAAVTCCVTGDDVIIIEPTEAEIKESVAVATFIFEGQNLKVLTAHQEGSLNEKLFQECLDKCKTAAKFVFNFYRQTIERKYDAQLAL